MYLSKYIHLYMCLSQQIHRHVHTNMRGRPKKPQNLFIKKLCIYSYIFKSPSPSKHSPSDAIHLSRCFSTAQNSFWTCQFWWLLVLLPFFVSLLPHQKMFPFEDFFHPGKQTNRQKVTQGEIRWMGIMGYRAHGIFGQKLLNTQFSVGRCTHKSPIMKWANMLKECSKKFTEAEHSLSQLGQLVHWYRRVPRTLTWKGKPVLQGACPPFFQEIIPFWGRGSFLTC